VRVGRLLSPILLHLGHVFSTIHHRVDIDSFLS
jgi:hypothetical protein